MNETDGARPPQPAEGLPERRPCSLGRIALPPERPRQRPSHLVIGPALGIVQPHASYEAARLTLLDGPHPVATEVPMPGQRRHFVPGILPTQSPALAHIAHHLGVGA